LTLPAPDDYVELSNVVLTIPEGATPLTMRCITVTVIGDIIAEPTETFIIQIAPENSNDNIADMEYRVLIMDETDGNNNYVVLLLLIIW
jgi:hypothetical protein